MSSCRYQLVSKYLDRVSKVRDLACKRKVYWNERETRDIEGCLYSAELSGQDSKQVQRGAIAMFSPKLCCWVSKVFSTTTWSHGKYTFEILTSQGEEGASGIEWFDEVESRETGGTILRSEFVVVTTFEWFEANCSRNWWETKNIKLWDVINSRWTSFRPGWVVSGSYLEECVRRLFW